MSGPGDELAELLWDNGPALRRPPAPFQPFTCSAAGSTRAHELKRHHAAGAFMGMSSVPLGMHDVVVGLHDDDDDVPWLHCPVVDDADADTAPLPPEYCAGLLSAGYPDLLVARAPPATATGIERPASTGAVVVPATRAPPPETLAKQPTAADAGAGEGVMNFTFFSRPLQRQQPTASNLVESTVVQAAASRLRSTPLFSEQRMAWLQPLPPKAPHAMAVSPPPPPPSQPPMAPEHHRVETAATVTQHRLLQAEARAPDAAATSSVCSGNGDRTQAAKMSSQQPTECSFSQDEELDDEPGAMRRSAARGTKHTRTAEVHNLSERRRRDRINEKMRALQELIPNCNKIDKASMLEEAIEYLKTLQLQVQMMSMGTGLCVPPMFLPAAAMQQHLLQMPPMAAHFPHLGAMGLGFGMVAPAFDMFPRVASAQFPCHAMPGTPPGAAMFGVPAAQAMPPSHLAPFLQMASASPAEQMDAAAAAPASGGAGAGDQPPAPVVAQGDQKLQHPKQT